MFVALGKAGIERRDFDDDLDVFNFARFAVIHIRTAHFFEQSGNMAKPQMRSANLYIKMGRINFKFDRRGKSGSGTQSGGK